METVGRRREKVFFSTLSSGFGGRELAGTINIGLAYASSVEGDEMFQRAPTQRDRLAGPITKRITNHGLSQLERSFPLDSGVEWPGPEDAYGFIAAKVSRSPSLLSLSLETVTRRKPCRLPAGNDA